MKNLMLDLKGEMLTKVNMQLNAQVGVASKVYIEDLERGMYPLYQIFGLAAEIGISFSDSPTVE